MLARANTNRVISTRMLSDTIGHIRLAFAQAEASIAPTVNEFVVAYRKQWETVTDDLTDEDGNVDTVARAARLRHWLIVSGWRNRLMDAYRSAAQTASQESLAATKAAQKSMTETGWNHARQLVIAAMQPAVNAGAPWRPKP